MASNKQIIVITGASNGIGYVTANTLSAASSDTHVVMGVRNLAKGERCLNEIQDRKPKGTVSLLELDVDKDDSIQAAVKKLEADYGRVDVLINNAGIEIPKPSPSRADLRAIFETNVFGPTVLTQALLPLLKIAKSPRIVNVTSILGSITYRSDPNHLAYQVQCMAYRMSKSALNMLTACQYKDLKPDGFKVWCFCPGYVITDLGGEDPEYRKSLGALSPETSAQGILEIVEGKRDAEAGTFIAGHGQQYPW